MKKLVVGILAHVDAGKTTLSEGLLYLTGQIRSLGRVDHQNAYLDTFALERARGITIFSKQAEISYKDMDITLVDTPGHVDFSSEMERTLQILDYAILVISGSEGIQGHTRTLWKLLKTYHIPAFIFVNKMDLVEDKHLIIKEMNLMLSEHCIDFTGDFNDKDWQEALAETDENALDEYLEQGTLSSKTISGLIGSRKLFPCFFGSALKLNGLEAFLNGLYLYTAKKNYSQEFGAKVFKITRDEQGARLTHMKITGGKLQVKDIIRSGRDNNPWEEKADQIRIYSGSRFEAKQEVSAGSLCAVTGLTHCYPGEGLGMEADSEVPQLSPVLSYQVLHPVSIDPGRVLTRLKQLEEEDPQLHVIWQETSREIQIQLMGEVQLEVIRSIVQDRFGFAISFGPGSIVYKETISSKAEGVGHFEPLRHYAEVHLLLEPLDTGSGLIFELQCSTDELDRNWQRLVLTHLEEKVHKGVLTGSAITDMKITLIAGRAHNKHTEGGDFREATYRAVRQGLKMADSVLLEPYYRFWLEVPQAMAGKAMADLSQRLAVMEPFEVHDGMAKLHGTAPVALMQEYSREVTVYTRGQGRYRCELMGYLPCHNAAEVIAAVGYDSEGDLQNPAGSVFCSHGAGFAVPWNRVREYMHLEGIHIPEQSENDIALLQGRESRIQDSGSGSMNWETAAKSSLKSMNDTQNHQGMTKELEDIFVRTYGKIETDRRSRYDAGGFSAESRNIPPRKPVVISEQEVEKKDYLLVDGYNIIFSWDELNEIAKDNLDAARTKLMDLLCNYQGMKQCVLILVFDAYKVKGNPGDTSAYHNIHVVYTKEAETADMYIEKVTHEIGRKHRVTVATSDALEQMIIMGQGALRYSAADLKAEISRVDLEIRENYLEVYRQGRDFPFKDLIKDLE